MRQGDDARDPFGHAQRRPRRHGVEVARRIGKIENRDLARARAGSSTRRRPGRRSLRSSRRDATGLRCRCRAPRPRATAPRAFRVSGTAPVATTVVSPRLGRRRDAYELRRDGQRRRASTAASVGVGDAHRAGGIGDRRAHERTLGPDLRRENRDGARWANGDVHRWTRRRRRERHRGAAKLLRRQPLRQRPEPRRRRRDPAGATRPRCSSARRGRARAWPPQTSLAARCRRQQRAKLTRLGEERRPRLPRC